MTRSTLGRWGLRSIALGYLLLLLLIPVVMVFIRTFEDGIAPAINAITTPEAQHAFWLTIVMVAVAVPVNTVFGVVCAIVLVRHRFRGKWLLDTIIDLPFAVSPVVVGLALILVYGQTGWFGDELASAGIRVIFSVPGMILATIFVSLPFVVREVVPVLREAGTEAEEAAHTLGAGGWTTFWRITLPAIRWGIAYGVVLTTARALGEFGAVAVVSGKLVGQTETATLFIEQRFQRFDLVGAYAASVVLALIAIAVLLLMHLLRPREGAGDAGRPRWRRMLPFGGASGEPREAMLGDPSAAPGPRSVTAEVIEPAPDVPPPDRPPPQPPDRD
jgi:sulfate transport system permease protein